MIRKADIQMVTLIRRMHFLENSMFWVMPNQRVAAMAEMVPVMTSVLVPVNMSSVHNWSECRTETTDLVKWGRACRR